MVSACSSVYDNHYNTTEISHYRHIDIISCMETLFLQKDNLYTFHTFVANFDYLKNKYSVLYISHQDDVSNITNADLQLHSLI